MFRQEHSQASGLEECVHADPEKQTSKKLRQLIFPVCMNISLIPRSSHHPVFDHLLQAIKNWTVGRPGNKATWISPETLRARNSES